MQPDDTASPVSLGARGILGARLKSRGARLKIEAAATETGQAKPPAGSRRYEGKGCPPALRLRSGQEGRHEGDPGAKNAALKAAALSATADANGAHDDDCRGGRSEQRIGRRAPTLFMSETIGFAEGELKSRRFFRDSGTAELRPPKTAVNLLTTYS